MSIQSLHGLGPNYNAFGASMVSIQSILKGSFCSSLLLSVVNFFAMKFS